MDARGNKSYVLATLVYAMLALAFTTLIYLDQKNSHNLWINKILEQGIESMHAILPDDLHSAALKGEPIDAEQEKKLAFALAKIAQSHGLDYLYTLVLFEGNQTKFVISSPLPEEVTENIYVSDYLADYTELNDVLVPVFSGDEDKFYDYEDRWGEFRSMFRPVEIEDGQTFILGADVGISEVKNALYKSILKTAVMLLLLFVVSLPLVYLIIKARQKEMQARMDKLMLDPMTGIKNRATLSSDLRTIEHPQLIVIDIIKFSDINNAYGPALADQIIINFTRHLQRYCHPKLDHHDVYRMQGDEFALLVNQAELPEDMERVFKDFLNYLSSFRYRISEQDVVRLKIHAGAVLNRKTDLITSAKIAHLAAREQNKPLIVFDEKLPQASGFQQNLRQLDALRKAVQEKRLVAWFQPIFSTKTNKVARYEALARIVDDDGNIQILPADFIPVAHRYGLYYQVTRSILDYCINWLSKNNAKVCINLSIKDIEHKATREHILSSIQKSRMGPRINFELLETEAMPDLELVTQFFKQLQRLGCRVGIDDLGKEYSNFDRFMALPIDFIKLDGGVIRAMYETNQGFDVFQKLVDLAHRKGMKVTAEFIANQEAMDIAIKLGCDGLQGYFLGTPAADEFTLNEQQLREA